MIVKSETKISASYYADKLRTILSRMPDSISDEEVKLLCKEMILTDSSSVLLSFSQCHDLVHKVYCSLRCELEVLTDLAEDNTVTEIMVNGPKDVFIERNGKVERADICFEDSEELQRIIQRLAARVGREINDLNPIVDARLMDGSRINAVNSNIAIGGPILTIRKFSKNRMSMDELIDNGCLTKEAASFLKSIVTAGYNILVSGGTSSGKTTFLNILSDYIPAHERVIVIEDSAELQIRGHENLVRMEAKAANAQGRGEVSIKDLIRTSLRMRPDRIIVGEVRGIEVIDMIAAMSTGHDGSLSTGHANSAKGMIRRLETMYLSGGDYPIDALRGQIEEAIEYVVQLERDSSGHRHLVEISEFLGYENDSPKLNKIFEYEEGKLRRTRNEVQRADKLRKAFT